MKQSNIQEDNSGSIATDLILLVTVIGIIVFGIWWVLNNFDFSSFTQNIVEGTLGTVAGITAGLFQTGVDFGTKYNPVNEWRKNRDTEGRRWYYLYLR